MTQGRGGGGSGSSQIFLWLGIMEWSQKSQKDSTRIIKYQKNILLIIDYITLKMIDIKICISSWIIFEILMDYVFIIGHYVFIIVDYVFLFYDLWKPGVIMIPSRKLGPRTYEILNETWNPKCGFCFPFVLLWKHNTLIFQKLSMMKYIFLYLPFFNVI